MFIHNEERIGSAYIELQYCQKKPLFKKMYFHKVKYFKDNSLLIGIDYIDEFLKTYVDYFDSVNESEDNCKLCYYGLNYYPKEATRKILEKLKKEKPVHSEKLIIWLEECIQTYNGFYVLGI